MELKRLPSDTIAKIRSSFVINTVCQSVLELVLNSLDAKATAVAVRVNIITLRIQVVDNGEGIPSENMQLVGLRYYTNKCKNLQELEKHIKYYGFRGEALANLAEVAKTVTISSRHKSSSQTYTKTLGKNNNGAVTATRERPSVGTTVTIEGLFHNYPVRKKRIIGELELDEILKNVKGLIIMHPEVDFSVRDDVNSELILSSRKTDDIISAFKHLHPDIKEDGTTMKISKGKLVINALLFRSFSESKRLQYIYVNKRPIFSSKITKCLDKLIRTNAKQQKSKPQSCKMHPIYILNIKCPYSDVDILLNPSKTMAQFKNWEAVERCIQKLINSFFGNNDSSHQLKTIMENPLEKKLSCGISQIRGVVRAVGYKRKNFDRVEVLSANKLKKSADKNKSILRNCQNTAKLQENENPDNDTFDIVESSPYIENKKKLFNFKQPLPITIAPKEKYLLPKRVSDEFCVNENSAVQREIECAKSISKFTNDESKGKTLIMDMFLKSTQVYNSEEDMKELSQGSQETIYEEESNFVVENNVQTLFDGVSKAMSISVNVKSTRKIRKHKKVNASKAVQTSLRNEMISKGLQTTFKASDTVFGDVDNKNINIPPDNYTLVLSKRGLSQHLKFVPKKRESLKNFNFTYTQKCNCHQNDNLFDFGKDASSEKSPDNYTFVFSKHGPSPYFKFVPKKAEISKSFNFSYAHKCSACKCHQNNNNTMFNFGKGESSEENIERSTGALNFDNMQGKSKLQTNTVFGANIFNNFNTDLLSKGFWKINKKPAVNTKMQPCEQSPYFRSKKQFRNEQNFNRHFSAITEINDRFKPNWCHDIPNHFFHKSRDHQTAPPNPVAMKYVHKNNKRNVDTFSDMAVGSYSNFRPAYRSTQQNKHQYLSHNEFQKPWQIEYDNIYFGADSFSNFEPKYLSTQKSEEKSEILFNFPSEKSIPNKTTVNDNCLDTDITETLKTIEVKEECINVKHSEPNVTLSEKEKLELLEKEMGAEKSLIMKEFLEWDSQFTQHEKEVLKKDDHNRTNRTHLDTDTNSKTGHVTHATLKKDNLFVLSKRYEFLPKGMSPILKEVKQVDKSLSQNGKDTLLEYIMETYKNELLYVKWQHYLTGIDANVFFDNMYKEKVKMFENCIPNVSEVNRKKKYSTSGIRFSKDLFKSIQIIGQLDKKFIVVKAIEENILIAFDQHAVHERIRLEQLWKIYRSAKATCKEKMVFYMSKYELSLLSRCESYLDYVGLSLEFFTNGVNVTEVPLCLYYKFQENSTESLNKMVQLLITEVIELLKSTRGASLKTVPRLIHNVVNLEACRGAIKFGDPLSIQQCTELLAKLSTTDLPFQCAHGRPTVTPLLRFNLNGTGNSAIDPVNFQSLRI